VKDVERNLLKLGQFKISGIVNFASRSTRGLNLESSLEELVETYKGVIAPTWNSILVFKKYIISGGSIINLGSIWGLLSPDPRVYLDMGNEPAIGLPGAKSAVIQISKYLSVLLAPDKIRVNCVVPGWFPAQRGMSRPDYVEGIKRRVPTNKIGTSDELVTSFLYLLDLNSSYTTGQTLIVDGGFSIW
jgi:gluconate 5-dehydrogenase